MKQKLVLSIVALLPSVLLATLLLPGAVAAHPDPETIADRSIENIGHKAEKAVAGIERRTARTVANIAARLEEGNEAGAMRAAEFGKRLAGRGAVRAIRNLRKSAVRTGHAIIHAGGDRELVEKVAAAAKEAAEDVADALAECVSVIDAALAGGDE